MYQEPGPETLPPSVLLRMQHMRASEGSNGSPANGAAGLGAGLAAAEQEHLPSLGSLPAGLAAEQEHLPSLGSLPAGLAAGSEPRPSPYRNIAAVKSNNTTAAFTIDTAQVQSRRELGGRTPLTEVLRQIMDSTKTRIDMSTSKSKGTTTFLISGKEEAVVRVRRELARRLSPVVNIKVPVPQSVRPHVIGARGQTLAGIMQRSGARITIPKRAGSDGDAKRDDDDDDDEILDIEIEGDTEGVGIAKAEIEQIVHERTSKATLRITGLDANFFPLLLEPGAELAASYEAPGKDMKIGFPQGPNFDSNCYVFVKGDKELANEFKGRLLELYDELRRTTIETQLPVPKRQHRFIVGERRSGLEEILKSTQCSVSVPPASSDSTNVTIRGHPNKIGEAIRLVLEKANEVTVNTLNIMPAHPTAQDSVRHARDMVRYLIRKKELSRIESMHEGVTIHPPTREALWNPDAQDMTLEISGTSPDAVLAARQELINSVNLLYPPRFAYLEIDPLLHQYVIGAKGRAAQRIRDSFKTLVMVADEDAHDPVVVLVYDETPLPSIAEVKETLERVAEDLKNSTSLAATLVQKRISLPVAYHRHIVGPQGSTLNAIVGDAKGRVSIQLGSSARAEQQRENIAQDDIIVRGQPGDVDRVISEIKSLVEEAKQHDILHSHELEDEFDERFSKNIIGRGGANITKIREELAVQITVDAGKIRIKGVKKNVEEAMKRIKQQLRRLEDDSTERLSIPQTYHSALIGQNGKFARKLEEKYDVRVHFWKATANPAESPADHPRGPDDVVIRGPKKGVAAAKTELLELYRYEQDNGNTATILVPRKAISQVVGRGGTVIESIRQEHGVQIDINDSREDAADEDDKDVASVTLRGKKDSVVQAEARIRAIVEQHEKEVTRTIHIPSMHHRHLIGVRGSTLRDTVVRAGGAEANVSRMVRFPRNGSTSDEVVLSGDIDVVDEIAKQFERIIQERESQVTQYVTVPVSRFGTLIGRGGATLQKLMSKHNVNIDVPKASERNADDAPPVAVTGQPAAVEAACAEIDLLCRVAAAKCVMVPGIVHHQLRADPKLMARLRNELRVTFDHGGQAIPAKPTARDISSLAMEESDSVARIDDDTDTGSGAWRISMLQVDSDDDATVPWNLRGGAGGRPDSVDTAVAILEQAVSRALAEPMCTGYLSVPREKHRFIIGSRGDTINGMRRETGCEITVPRTVGDDVVVISGGRDAVEKTRELILAAIRE